MAWLLRVESALAAQCCYFSLHKFRQIVAGPDSGRQRGGLTKVKLVKSRMPAKLELFSSIARANRAIGDHASICKESDHFGRLVNSDVKKLDNFLRLNATECHSNRCVDTMKVSAVDLEDLSRSVIAVPPVAQTADMCADPAANRLLIDHLVRGGVTALMYGGNANFYNIPISAYADTLEMLVGLAPDDAWIIPAIGPDFGRMVDQIDVARDMEFPAVMTLPHYPDSGSSAGVMIAMRKMRDRLGKPLLVYVKHERGLSADEIATLVEDGVAGWIKYALVTPDPGQDAYLSRLLERVDARRVISGIGERPVIEHFTSFGLSSFTSGSACIAPALSASILAALTARDHATANRLREHFLPFEDCRDALGPARVIHDGVTLAGIADLGVISPLQSNLEPVQRAQVGPVAQALLAQEMAHRGVRQ